MKKTDKGVSLLEVLLVIGIMVMVIPKVYENIENHLNNVRWQNAAEHANTYNTAVRNYVADNASTLLAGSLPKTITPATLIQKGYLKSGFSESNFGQSYITGIAKNSKTSRLEALTCSNGGQSLSEAGMRSVASMIEGLGGYINSSKQAIGAGGGWSDTPSNYGLNCATGHIAMALVGADLQESDRLYRYSITNRPDLNRMHTAIDMNSNNLNNVGTLNGNAAALSGDISARNGTFSGAISGNTATTNGDITSNNGWLVTKNSKGWMNSTYGGGWYMSDSSWLRSVNNKGIYTGGQVKGGTVRADGRLYTGEYLQLEKTATAGASCSPNGLVGRDSTGAILSCQSGTWRMAQVVTELIPVILVGHGNGHVHLQKVLGDWLNADSDTAIMKCSIHLRKQHYFAVCATTDHYGKYCLLSISSMDTYMANHDVIHLTCRSCPHKCIRIAISQRWICCTDPA
ncbi:shufflon system plasmid conjugative transfer pilus tip adhesin PilV [Escherichia coli]|uniref:shufflon system plasmid conjugative transfer pilus tip adhesin PilV n=1 Tax=Escherichia coli TaxID=562 RepID=UPI0020201D7F|nr:shufflon system plasmid conjugative transfer pilus tip adhesin PilV [Escherichia coli]